jgi:hypothetical protein
MQRSCPSKNSFPMTKPFPSCFGPSAHRRFSPASRASGSNPIWSTPRPKALIAIARKLLGIMLALVRTQTEYAIDRQIELAKVA